MKDFNADIPLSLHRDAHMRRAVSIAAAEFAFEEMTGASLVEMAIWAMSSIWALSSFLAEDFSAIPSCLSSRS